VHPVFQEEWSITFLIVRRAAVDELVETVDVVNTVTGRHGAAVEAAGEVVGEVVEALPADVGSEFQIMLAEERREVVNELVIGLVSLNGKIAGAADAGLRGYRAGVEEANYRSVVAGRDVDKRGP